jgi:two-component system response regulator AtoC
MKPVILVIDDEEAIRLFLKATLEDEGYDVSTYGLGQEAIDELEHTLPDLVLLDLMLPDMSGIQVLEKIKKALPHVCVVMVTAYDRTDSAVQAMKLDAFDYVSKPIQIERLFKVVASGLEFTAEARAHFRASNHTDLFRGIENHVPSQSPAMQEIYEVVRKVSGGDSTTVLLEGESGVGKDVIAHLIHRTSPRREFPFLDINCATLPELLLESELFGHEKGAFTDASNQKLGLLELANSGTIFLDEIGEMALTVQAKLLRVMEKMIFRRLGGLEDIQVNVRIIAATNRNLAAQVRAGTFRQDLYYRLKVVDLRVPPLRARQEDVVPLTLYFLKFFSGKFGKNFKEISPEARQCLLEYQWPGNIRELRNIIERTVLLEEGPALQREHLRLMQEYSWSHELPVRLQEVLENPLPRKGIELESMVAELEEALVRKALVAADGNQTRAAALLGLNRDKFRYRMKQYDVKES